MQKTINFQQKPQIWGHRVEETTCSKEKQTKTRYFASCMSHLKNLNGVHDKLPPICQISEVFRLPMQHVGLAMVQLLNGLLCR
jgi:hypothetical protein